MITIQATPPAYSSVHGDLIYTVAEVVHTADPVTYPNYKFIGDVYINSTLVARIKKGPDPITKIGIFNVGQVVRNYISTTFNPTANALIAQSLTIGQFNLSVTMKFGEEYAYTAYYTLVTDSARVFFNNYNGRGQLANVSTKVNIFASNKPSATSVINSSFNFVPFFAAGAGPYSLSISTYNFSSALITTSTYSFSPVAVNDLMMFNLSTSGINAQFAGLINTNVKFYTVTIGAVTYRFDITCEAINQIFTVHFLNSYGGFESKDFAKVSRKTIAIEKKDFGKLPYTVDSSGVVSYKNSNNVYNESRSVYSAQYKEKLTLNSDNLTDAEYVWLQELVLSPMVYIEESGSFFPCVLVATDYEPRKYINDDLTNLTINVEYGNQLNTQYR